MMEFKLGYIIHVVIFIDDRVISIDASFVCCVNEKKADDTKATFKSEITY